MVTIWIVVAYIVTCIMIDVSCRMQCMSHIVSFSLIFLPRNEQITFEFERLRYSRNCPRHTHSANVKRTYVIAEVSVPSLLSHMSLSALLVWS